ncbi:MAG TPA: helix-turn-helix domain-containing protein [Pyrinomonadaceae bacterium]
MRKDKKDSNEDFDGLISISEAARIRSVSHTAIQDLIKREKLSSIEIGGRRFLRRDEVVSFIPESVGRPQKAKAGASKVSKKGGEN